MSSERLIWKFLPEDYTLGYVKYWSTVPSGRTLSIDTGTSWLLAVEPPFHALPTGAWLPLVPGYLTHVVSVLLITLSLITRSS